MLLNLVIWDQKHWFSGFCLYISTITITIYSDILFPSIAVLQDTSKIQATILQMTYGF